MQHDKTVRIFISYRWEYSYAEAKLLQRSIASRFENVVVFRDEERATPGESLTEQIIGFLNDNPVVLALFHKDWQRQPTIGGDSYQNKLFKTDDWVFMELNHAHHIKNLSIIPILCYGAVLPPRNDEVEKKIALPPALHFLSDDILAKPFNKSNDSEEAILKFLKEKFGLTERAQTDKAPPPNRLKEEGLELPDVMPSKDKEKGVPIPYLGLSYYEEKHARLFFGRNEDILTLWNMIERKPERLLLLYGYSGVGKSSLLHAGLFPRVKQKGWTVLAKRREKDKGLTALLEELLNGVSATGKTLIAIDQLEEALIEPGDAIDELPVFFQRIKTALDAWPNLNILLGFRKEFLSEIQEQVNRNGLTNTKTECFLKPLSEEGILEAIALDEGIRTYYNYNLADGLANDIATGIIERGVQLHSGEVSSKAPWLQLLLLNLWQAAEKEQGDLGVLNLEHRHLEAVRSDTFPRLVENQLSKMAEQGSPHCDFYENGLTLDLLAYLTTAGGTAAIRADEELLKRYPHKEQEMKDHLRLLENLQLVTRISSRNERLLTRLAHDALAPVIRRRFEASNWPVQRGHRIFASKKTVDQHGNMVMDPIQDKDDIALLREAKPFMCRWSEDEEAAFAKGENILAKEEAERRANMAYIFDSFADVGKDLIYSLDHEQALEKFQIAFDVELDFETKKQKLYTPLEELFFFFAEGERQPEKARAAAQLLLQLQPAATLRAGLEKCIAEAWQHRSQFTPLLKALASYAALQKRYYPDMITIKGDTFKMGSPEKEEGHQSDELQHKVKVSSFNIATTPLTFYQYALHCQATGKSIATKTPSWGRRGDHPIVNMSWYDAVEFCNWLSLHQGLSPCYKLLKEAGSDENNKVANDYMKWKVDAIKGSGFRLPTEAEWEFAARGGNRKQDFRFAGSKEIEEVAWYWKNSGDQPLSGRDWDLNRVLENNGRTYRVAAKKHNGIGLYDMSGNVFEWCWDWYQEDYYKTCKSQGIVNNPKGAESSNTGRVLRGGSWRSYDLYCRVAFRSYNDPDYRNSIIGFLLAQDF
ncbi:MAG: SUMF1/EgtB/PvdO family nonheme iron enzyme [Saprospiraceae bacterium]